jgi:hypothetical protein
VSAWPPHVRRLSRTANAATLALLALAPLAASVPPAFAADEYAPPDIAVTAPAADAGAAVIPPGYPPAGFAYGMQAHLYYQDVPAALGLVQGAGFGWVKQQVRWADVEAITEQPDWAPLDAVVDTAAGQGLRVLLSVVTAPSWTRADGRTDGPPDDPAILADFVGRLAARYAGRVQAYEVWNEQNLSREWGGDRISAGSYVELLKAAYPAIKAADPDTLVLSGALTPTGILDPAVAVDDVLYLREMYAYEDGVIKSLTDAIGAHAGGYNNPPEADPVASAANPTGRFRNHSSFYFRRIEQLHDVLVRYGDPRKAWITEFGWSTANQAPGYEYGNDNTAQDQASYLVRAFQWVKTNDPWVAGMFVWNLNFATLPDLPLSDEKPPFGILNRDWTPRPAYSALQAMPK